MRELPTMSPPQEVPQSDKPFGRGFGNSSAVVLMLLVLQLLAPESTMSLRYDRAAILDGEAWRLLTGQLVHLGWTHCLLNVGGWIVGALLFPKLFARRRFWLEVGAIAIGVGLGLLLLDPKLAHYVGLSGVIYGVLVRGSLPSAGRDWRMTTLLLLIVGRLASQVWVGPGASEEEMIGGAIIVSAHVYGAMMGALLSLGPRVLR